MDVATLWIRRKGEDTPELLTAWDGWCIEANWEGWEKDCKERLAAVGDDAEAVRYLNLSIPDSELNKYFKEWQTIPVAKVSKLDDPAAI